MKQIRNANIVGHITSGSVSLHSALSVSKLWTTSGLIMNRKSEKKQPTAQRKRLPAEVGMTCQSKSGV